MIKIDSVCQEAEKLINEIWINFLILKILLKFVNNKFQIKTAFNFILFIINYKLLLKNV